MQKHNLLLRNANSSAHCWGQRAMRRPKPVPYAHLLHHRDPSFRSLWRLTATNAMKCDASLLPLSRGGTQEPRLGSPLASDPWPGDQHMREIATRRRQVRAWPRATNLCRHPSSLGASYDMTALNTRSASQRRVATWGWGRRAGDLTRFPTVLVIASVRVTGADPNSISE